jgi:hypothetical protein
MLSNNELHKLVDDISDVNILFSRAFGLFDTYEIDHLVGKKYRCIFDEKTHKLDIENPHTHLIKRAVYINLPRNTIDGIALLLEDGGWITGCDEKDIQE